MATFVVMSKWTDKSLEAMKDHTVGEKIKQVIKDMGAEIKGWYMLMGQYDEMCILEAPDAETVARIVIALTAQYGGKSETLRAFSAEEVKKLCPSQGK
jgi:uncharacterized protein with GYD domain